MLSLGPRYRSCEPLLICECHSPPSLRWTPASGQSCQCSPACACVRWSSRPRSSWPHRLPWYRCNRCKMGKCISTVGHATHRGLTVCLDPGLYANSLEKALSKSHYSWWIDHSLHRLSELREHNSQFFWSKTVVIHFPEITMNESKCHRNQVLVIVALNYFH